MAVTVTINQPPDDPSGATAFSAPPPEYTASGTVQPDTPAELPVKMAYQIDDGPLNQIDISDYSDQAGNPWNWSFTLTEDDCPTACGTYYSLIVFAYNDNGSYSQTVDFQRTT